MKVCIGTILSLTITKRKDARNISVQIGAEPDPSGL